MNQGGAFRPDVEGLRAIAVAMVFAFHLGLPWASGGYAGVDVFFVISGFLITGVLLREVETSGRVSVLAFYARRARRLLPAAAAVLAACLVATWAILPAGRALATSGDVAAAALYVLNWRLAWQSVDYLAEDAVASSIQNFWSLSIEEQYYIVWPLVAALALRLAGDRLSRRAVFGLLLLSAALPSLAWSVLQTRADGAYAYFSTLTRVWELALGGGLAVAAPWLMRLGRRQRSLLGWAGLLAILVSTALFTTGSAWPGHAALLPTLGAAAVIVAGLAGPVPGLAAVLGHRLMVWLGGLSYSIYLVHWPLIVFATELGWSGGVAAGAGLTAAALLLAWGLHHLVENPVRFAPALQDRPALSLSLGLNLVMLVAIASLGLQSTWRQQAQLAAGAGQALPPPGAMVLGSEPARSRDGVPPRAVDWIVPAPELAPEDVPALYARGCQLGFAADQLRVCEFGKADGRITLAVVGDSKIAQWLPALELLAHELDLRILTLVKSACSFNAAPQSLQGRDYVECARWNAQAQSYLERTPGIDVVLTSHGRRFARDPELRGADTALVDGFVASWQRLRARGIRVIALADNAHPGRNIYECVQRHRDDLRACAFDRREGSGTPSLREAAGRAAVPLVDLNDHVCPRKRCSPVIGNVLVYRQGSHLTATYVRTLAPVLRQRLAAAMAADIVLSDGLPADTATPQD